MINSVFPYQSKTVLVVDDDPFTLKLVKAILGKMDFFQILTANNVGMALEYLAQYGDTIKLVISDLNMPECDGLELLQNFEEQGFKGDILLFSGEHEEILKMSEKLAKERHLSVIGSLQKPVKPETLRQALFRKSPGLSKAEKKQNKKTVTVDMLRDAISANEIVPWFQPKIEIGTQTPIGVEALARWPACDIGPVFPDEFIPLAENHGLIDDLTLHIVQQSLVIQENWMQKGIGLEIAINLSMDSLINDEFSKQLLEVIEKFQLDGKPLKFEVTESRLMDSLVKPLQALLRLKMKQFQLSIDDFGTGHSNLSQLRDLPFDELKLDRSFIHDELAADKTTVILESSIDIAKKLNMSIVAEGVETLDDWNKLDKLGCDQVQGYLISKPMPADEFVEWLDQWPDQRHALFVQ